VRSDGRCSDRPFVARCARIQVYIYYRRSVGRAGRNERLPIHSSPAGFLAPSAASSTTGGALIGPHSADQRVYLLVGQLRRRHRSTQTRPRLRWAHRRHAREQARRRRLGHTRSFTLSPLYHTRLWFRCSPAGGGGADNPTT